MAKLIGNAIFSICRLEMLNLKSSVAGVLVVNGQWSMVNACLLMRGKPNKIFIAAGC